MYSAKPLRYQKVDGKQVIQIRINKALQLFDSRDPAPFRDRDLDDDFTDYVITSADEIPQRFPIKLQISIAGRTPDLDAESIVDAIRSHFSYQIDLKKIQFSKMLRMARLFLAVGLVILTSCLFLARWTQTVHSEFVGSTLREGIVIFGWVSLWKPIELILFDWYPIYERIELFQKILNSEIEIRFDVNTST